LVEVFVDTSAWYPAMVRSHQDHERVAIAMQDAVRAGVRLVTSNLVVAETHALLLNRVGRNFALTFAQTVIQPPMVVVPSTVELEDRAVRDWLVRYDDQHFSLADAVSFAVMKARGITQAVALDAHFASAGFRVLPALAAPARRPTAKRSR
jgi:predicted nucleic acid-binding protein